MSWFKKLIPSKIRTSANEKRDVPEGVWSKCNGCNSMLYSAELERNLFVCTKCSEHQRIGARKRLNMFLDPEQKHEIAVSVLPNDKLKFRDSQRYRDRLVNAQKKTKEVEALIAYSGTLHGMPVVACSFDFDYMGGSMGAAVGERFVQAANAALNNKMPFICFTTSGGARMQEGLISLMQMAKTSAVLTKLTEQQLPYIAVLCDPTMGGVSASLAMLGDVIIAEPNARIGFAGARVIEQTVRETLPAGFQRSEFLLQHGAIDMITDRRNMRNVIANIIAKLMHHKSVPIEADNFILTVNES